MIVQSGTSILAVKNEALSNEIKEWLSIESMKYDQDWLVERIRNRHKCFNTPTHFYLTWHHTAKFMENCNINLDTIILNEGKTETTCAHLIRNGYHPEYTIHSINIVKDMIEDYDMPLEYVPHHLRTHPGLLCYFIQQRAFNLLPIGCAQEKTTLSEDVMCQAYYSPSLSVWRKHIQGFVVGPYRQGEELHSLLHSFGKTPEMLTQEEIDSLRHKLHLNGDYLVEFWSKEHADYLSRKYTSFSWLDDNKTLFYVTIYGTDLKDVYHISGKRLVSHVYSIQQIDNSICIENAYQQNSYYKWNSKTQELKFWGIKS